MDAPTLSEDALKLMLEQAAESGARKALSDLGLSDETAAHDLRDLRDLLSAYRSAKQTVMSTIIQTITVAVLTAISTVVYIKFGVTPKS